MLSLILSWFDFNFVSSKEQVIIFILMLSVIILMIVILLINIKIFLKYVVYVGDIWIF